MKTIFLGLLSIYFQPSWAASQFLWNLSVGPEVKVAGDNQVQFPAGDWNCTLSKNVGIDKKEIRQLECVLGDKEKTQLTAVCDDLSAWDMQNVALPQKKGGSITAGLSCSKKR